MAIITIYKLKHNIYLYCIILYPSLLLKLLYVKRNGKSIKLNRQDMAQLQTLLAESLGMERGISSDKVHLEAQQFKNEAEIRRLESVLAER